MIGAVVYGAGGEAANPATTRPQGGKPIMPKGVTVLLSLVLLAAGACGAAPPPAARGDVERGTALPPPGYNATAVRR